MSQHNVEVNVNANTAGAQKSLNYLSSLMDEFGKQATNRFAAILGAAAVAKMAFDKVTQSISANIATAKQVSQMAIKFNIDPAAMHSITMAAKDAGVSVRSLTMAMKQLGQYAGKALSSKEMQINFKQLGIEADKLNEIQKAPSKFLPEIAKALMEIGDENQRSAAGATLLGRQYQQLLPLIEELGSSEEARKKFLDNENAMTEEQIAANKEIAQMQNDLSDGFDKMVASVAPLLKWAMSFVSLLAEGLGYIKDMIFESDKEREAREARESANVAKKVFKYQAKLKEQQEAGTLSEKDREGIEKAGSVEKYVSKQLIAIDTYEKERQAAKALVLPMVTDVALAQGGDFAEKRALQREHTEKSREAAKGATKEFAIALGLEGTEQEKDDFVTASATGALALLAKKGAKEGMVNLRERETKTEEEYSRKEYAKFVKVRSLQASLLGQIYDAQTDKTYSKGEYQRLLEKRGVSKEDIGIKIRGFEKEEDRVKREKTERESERKLATSERKLYVGDPALRQYKMGLDEVEKAEDAVIDAREAQVGPLEDLVKQQEVYMGIESDLAKAKRNQWAGEKGAEADVLRLSMQLSVEKQKLNDLQVKANDLKGAEVSAVEALKRAQEKLYREEEKRKDSVYERIKAEEDHDKQMKYKLMKAEGSSALEIQTEQLKDEQVEYEKMVERYLAKFNEAQTNKAKGLKGEALSEDEISELEGLTKALDQKRRSIQNTAFDLGNLEDKGQVTSMRRIGGGGMEFGGLANTARLQLEQAQKQTAKLDEIKGLLADATGVQVSTNKEGRTFAEVASDGSPR